MQNWSAILLFGLSLITALSAGELSPEQRIDLQEYWSQTPRELPKALKPFFWSEPEVQPGPPPDIQKLVDELGADSFRTRKAAMQALAELGSIAKEALEKAALSDDPETSERARSLLADIKPSLDVSAYLEKLRQEASYRTTSISYELRKQASTYAGVIEPGLFHLRTLVGRRDLLRMLEDCGTQGHEAARWLSVIPHPLRDSHNIYFPHPYRLESLYVHAPSFSYLSRLKTLETEHGAKRFSKDADQRKAYRVAVAELQKSWAGVRAKECKKLAPQLAFLERIAESPYGPYRRHGQIWLYLSGALYVDYLWTLFEASHPVLRNFAAAQLVQQKPEALLKRCAQLLDSASLEDQLHGMIGLQSFSQVDYEVRDKNRQLGAQQHPHHARLKPLVDADQPVLQAMAIRSLVPYKSSKVYNNGRSRSTSSMSVFRHSSRKNLQHMLEHLEEEDFEVSEEDSSFHYLARELRETDRAGYIHLFKQAQSLHELPPAIYADLRLALTYAGAHAVLYDLPTISPSAYTDQLPLILEWLRYQRVFEFVSPEITPDDELREILAAILQYGKPDDARYVRLSRIKISQILGREAQKDAAFRKRLWTMAKACSAANRADLLSALAYAGDADVIPALRTILLDEDAHLQARSLAAMSLGQLKDEVSKSDIYALLQTNGLNETVGRMRVVLARCQFRDRESEGLVRKLIQHVGCNTCGGSKSCSKCEGAGKVALAYAMEWELDFDPSSCENTRMQKTATVAKFVKGDDSLIAQAIAARYYATLTLPDGRIIDLYPDLIGRINQFDGPEFAVVPFSHRYAVDDQISAWWENEGKEKYDTAEEPE